MEAIELKAPQASTADATILRGQIFGGVIFSAFSDQARAGILTRLQSIDGLIPSLYNFFQDVHYLEALAGCMTRLIRLKSGDTVSSALARAFSNATNETDKAIVQIAETSFVSCLARSVDPVKLGLRQLYAYAMRHYPQMPKTPRSSTKRGLTMRSVIRADPTVLRGFAELAERLGFESPEITALKHHPTTSVVRTSSEKREPLLVTDGAGVAKRWRCRLPQVEETLEETSEDSQYLFINHLDRRDEEQGEGITPFFVRKSIYSAFFGKSSPLALEEESLSEEAAHLVQEQ